MLDRNRRREGTFTRRRLALRGSSHRRQARPGREYRAYGSLAEDDRYDKGVLSVGARIDAEKFLLLARLNIVGCVAYIGAQRQSR
ncbi:hypothetical protein ASC92_25825 [Variovorax sp. Root411]|nr:hypothetical protein ASC92_25825 [Variovorax sp. Root411]